MNRRSYLATCGALGASVTLAGSPVSDGEADSFSVTSPRVEQGETAIIAIETTEPGSMRFSELPGEIESPANSGPLGMGFENAEFTPPPDVVWQAYPPTWTWSSTRAIEGEIPVRTASDTPPGTYEFAVTVYRADENVTKEATVTVV